ncbi:MAG: NAD(P)/FAD-dependent oxidoreductase [Candidatus Omnitrophica bacterium]|nr:NAD(P)/FAD-dependent oxidoreductase [Candidatus Omnitrophota bacterium]
MEKNKIVVVGAGPAGMMAAIRAAEVGQQVTLIERNSRPGKKLLLSGKGRCNLTNTCELGAFLRRFSRNGEFLRDAFRKFFHQELIQFFEKRGLKLKVERQLRVFPVSNRSNSILEVLKKELSNNKVKVIYKARMKDVFIREQKVRGLLLEDSRVIPADKIILATGGASYSFTGSSLDGINLARKLGHQIVELRPGLVPLETRQNYPRLLEGLTLKNIRLKFSDFKKELISEIGELLFTDFGISGPLVLSLSGEIADWLKISNNIFVEIDFKPALSAEQLEARFLREFNENPKKTMKNILKGFLPQRMVKVFIEIAKINPDKKTSQITQEERRRMIKLLKGFRLDILRTRPLEEAMVTRGGVSLKEINPRTMESRLVPGLYFCGEMIDVDADTGGFNLQAAFSTGYLAGESAAL